jgi:hypothetical protein
MFFLGRRKLISCWHDMTTLCIPSWFFGDGGSWCQASMHDMATLCIPSCTWSISPKLTAYTSPNMWSRLRLSHWWVDIGSPCYRTLGNSCVSPLSSRSSHLGAPLYMPPPPPTEPWSPAHPFATSIHWCINFATSQGHGRPSCSRAYVHAWCGVWASERPRMVDGRSLLWWVIDNVVWTNSWASIEVQVVAWFVLVHVMSGRERS